MTNFDNWQQYVVNVIDANFPVVDVSNLLSDTSGMCIVYLTHTIISLQILMLFTIIFR